MSYFGLFQENLAQNAALYTAILLNFYAKDVYVYIFSLKEICFPLNGNIEYIQLLIVSAVICINTGCEHFVQNDRVIRVILIYYVNFAIFSLLYIYIYIYIYN